MPFSAILGQEKPLTALRSALSSGHLHHAYLFCGPDGVGKELSAVTLAQAANCARGDGDACGVCTSCRKIASFNHPDILWVMPEAEMVARKRAGRADFSGTPSKDIRISQIRGIQESLAFRPLEAKTRFIFICGAHAMNIQAQNALLKTLEEPPQSTVIILVTEAPGQLLATIRSRCLKVSFSPLSEDVITSFLLAEKKGLDEETARRCAALSGGSLSAALAMDLESLAQLEERLTRLARLDEGDILEALQFAEDLAAEKKGAVETALSLFEAWYRDVALTASADIDREDLPLICSDMRPAIRLSAQKLGAAEALRRIQLCRGVRARLRFNASPRLQLEQLFLRFNRSEA